MTPGVKLGEVYTDFGQGSLRETGNTFDLALEGKGFFQIAVANENGNEQIYYTRDGSFTMTRDGNIVDMNGNSLVGESGNITVPEDATDIVIDTDGSVYADGVFVDKVLITDFEDYNYLKKYGENMYSLVEGGTQMPATASIHQGYTEQPNVNVVSEMVDMIAITRAYEANQKVIQTVDNTLEQAVNSVGKV